MWNFRNIFFNLPNETLLEIYNDIKEAKEEGYSSTKLRDYAQYYQSSMQHETFLQALSFAEKCFYEEVARRFFENTKQQIDYAKRCDDEYKLILSLKESAFCVVEESDAGIECVKNRYDLATMDKCCNYDFEYIKLSELNGTMDEVSKRYYGKNTWLFLNK